MKKLTILVMLIFLSNPILAVPNDNSSGNNGAVVTFSIGDLVTFLRILTTNGKVIIKEVGKKF